MAKKHASSGTPATVALDRAGVEYEVRAYHHDPAASFGLEAAEALGVDPARVLKTLLVDTGSGLAVGYVVGGISPVGQKRALPTVLDQSAVEQSTVLVSGGRRGFDLELAPADLVAVTRAVTAPIAR